MIRISFEILVIVYLVAFLAVVSTLWALYESRRHRKARHSLRNRLRCKTCGYEFEDPTDAELSQCPRCDTLNERDKPEFL